MCKSFVELSTYFIQIRKKLAALNREEEKIAEEARKKEVEENEVHRAEEDRKKKEVERRNIAIAAAGLYYIACLIALLASFTSCVHS